MLRVRRSGSTLASTRLWVGLPIVLALTSLAVVAFPQTAGSLGLAVMVHMQDIGDRQFREGQFAGTRGQSRRVEGVSIALSPPVSGLSIQYMAHLQDVGDTPWVADGTFVGTRGQSRRMEGIAIRLAGPLASQYNVVYRCHIQDVGDSAWMRNGAFCGTRGQSRRLEGIEVAVVPR